VTDVPPATVTPLSVPEITTLPAEIDAGNSGQAGRELRAAFRPGVSVVIADMTQTTFADSSALRALLEAQDTAAASQAELRLVIPGGTVLRALQITGLDRLFRIYPSMDAALSNRAPASP
jgi:anti-sigma B factor antagonist